MGGGDDFRLRGYGSGEEIAFEDGKRCNLSGEQSRYDDSSQERATIDETMRAMIGDERGAWHQIDRFLLNGEQFRQAANSEERIAARFIGSFSPSLETLRKLCVGLDLWLSTLFESFEIGERNVTRELADLLACRSPREVQLATRVLRAMFDELDALAAEGSEPDDDD